VVMAVDTRGVNGKDKGVGRGWIWWNPVQVLVGDNSILLGWHQRRKIFYYYFFCEGNYKIFVL
jgi:hypothetical protein